MDELRVSILSFDFSCKHPVSCSLRCEVFLLHPGRAFSWVSPSGPPPQLFKDRMIHRVKDFTAGPESVVVGPSPDNRIELDHDLSRRAILVFFDDSSNLFEERLHVLLRGTRQYSSIVVLTYVLTEEVEAVLNGGDDGFLLRQGESSFLQECFDAWFHLLFEKVFGCSCDNKVIGIPCQINFRTLPICWPGEVFPKMLAETIEGHIRNHG